MNDTSERIQEKFKELMLAQPGSERLMMGFEMFEASRTIMKASFGAKRLESPRIQLLKRLYKNDLEPEVLDSVAERIRLKFE